MAPIGRAYAAGRLIQPITYFHNHANGHPRLV